MTAELKTKIVEWLEKEYTEEWVQQEKVNRVSDYVDDDDIAEWGGDDESAEEAYDSLCTGEAVETDIFEEIAAEIRTKFEIDIYAGENHEDYNAFYKPQIEKRIGTVFPNFGAG